MATELHREALAGLTYGVTHRKGFIVLLGEAGTGKTTVLRSVIDSLSSETVHFGYILNPALSPDELIEHALLDLGIEPVPASKTRRLLALGEFLAARHREGQVSALIIDEAHELTPEVLEEIRLLTNFETNTEKLLQIVLVGQPELGELLNRPDLRQLKQRIALRYRVKPLAPDEVLRYVQHRWSKAGGTQEPPFTEDALELVKEYSQGIPRLINALCENGLAAAFSEQSRQVDGRQIERVAEKLDLLRPQADSATEPLPPAGDFSAGGMSALDRETSGKTQESPLENLRVAGS
jgi:general secretion pathway protein A